MGICLSKNKKQCNRQMIHRFQSSGLRILQVTWCVGGVFDLRIFNYFLYAFLSSSGELTSRAVHGPSSTIPVLLIGKKYEFENVDHAIKIWDTLRYLTRARPEGSTHDSGAGSRINPIPKQFKWKTFENYISSPILSQ